MRKPVYSDSWPDSWKESYHFNELELWGNWENPGYTYAYANRRGAIIDAACRLLPKGAKILDVAAAHGNFTLPLAERGYKLVWNDIRADLEGYVRLKYEKGDVDYVAGNCFELLPAHAGTFDAVIATEIIEHVAHPDQFLADIAKLLRPGGYILLSTPNGRWVMNKLPRFSDFANPEIFETMQFKPDADGHIFLLHPDEFFSLAQKSGLRVAEFCLINSVFVSGNRHLAKLLRYVPKSLVALADRLVGYLPKPLKEKLTSTAIVVYQKP